MDFPHLKDTQFPLIDNVNVYKYKNNFDYARWNGKVSFKLLNVLWNSNYADVPYFNTVEERDEWFDSQEGYVGTLESLFNNTPENTVKIPIPYNDAYNYNYLVVDMPMQTSVDNPINFEDNTRVSRWFYFIEDLTQFAPSTTELRISVDYWTTFIHSVEIPYLMLERGHAPMMQITPEQFLANPIMNNEYLLADDFNYGNDTVISDSVYKPIGNGIKYVLFCAPYTQDDFSKFDGSIWSGNATPPSYADTAERWGYQIVVNDYLWKYGNTDYSGADLPIHNGTQNGILNGCNCFAIEGQYAEAFFNEMATYHVNFIHGIKAMFILSDDLFTKTSFFNFNGYTLYNVGNKTSVENITLTKSQFGFDEKYAEITKLYTFPYSSLEVTDDEGNSFTAKIENCGRMEMHKEVSLVYPFLNYNVFFSGINGNDSNEYMWTNLNGTNVTKEMWESDFSKYMMNWNIPTYTIYVSAENEYAANNAAQIAADRARAIKDYENAVRYANTTRQNTADSFATNTANVNATQYGLMENMEDTNATNDHIVDDLQNSGSFGSQAAAGNGYISRTAWANFEKVADDADSDWIVIQQGFDTAVDYAVGMGILNAGSALVGGSIQSGGEGFGSSGGVAVPLVSGICSAITTSAGISCTITKDSNLKTIQQQAIERKVSNARTQSQKLHDAQKDLGYGTKEANNDLREEITTRFSGTNGINNENASRTQSTETTNATWTREANVAAEKANLVQKQLDAEAAYKSARLQKPSEYSNYSGDFMPDAYQRRGVRLNVRTQSKSAIAQAGDAMLRFGYALHRVWDMSNGFHYCNNFTFWKAEDIWINDGSGVANIATNTIAEILLKGVTIWRDPTKIGTVGIYDNI